MPYQNLIDVSAAVQAEIRKTVIGMKQENTPTLGSFKSSNGARKEAGGLAGLEIPLYDGKFHGSVALNPIDGTTSFGRMVAPTTNKMYVGLAFQGFTVEHEWFHEADAQAGKLPEDQFSARDKVMMTYLQEQNWYRIGKGNGSLAEISVIGGGTGGAGTVTFTNTNTARGRSKGSIRLAVSPSSTKTILYESYTESTDTKTATFYITSKPNATQAAVVITDGGTIVAGDIVVKAGHYKKVAYGLGYHIESSARQYQGIDTTNYGFLNSRAVNGGNALVTPTLLDTAKGAKQTRANSAEAGRKAVCHLTMGNYKTLAGYGYNLRAYNAEKGDADTTFGLPNNFEDEDCVFIQDADMEDAYIYIRDKKSYFEYRQKELQEVTGRAEQYVGASSRGSTEFYRNWGEAFNFAWDARGDDGKGKPQPNSSIVIYNLAIPANNQVAEGLSLV